MIRRRPKGNLSGTPQVRWRLKRSALGIPTNFAGREPALFPLETLQTASSGVSGPSTSSGRTVVTGHSEATASCHFLGGPKTTVRPEPVEGPCSNGLSDGRFVGSPQGHAAFREKSCVSPALRGSSSGRCPSSKKGGQPG